MFDWTSYFVLARELAKRPEEASRRTAVSRAYYAIFNKARLLLEGEGTVVSSTGGRTTTSGAPWRVLKWIGRSAIFERSLLLLLLSGPIWQVLKAFGIATP
jgi:hypothetical protein